ncbi:homeobox KN domain-containing protein [Armillaria borealis]|uniref:Homeobox KN domain-containing protein n=2 Tax=Armillaria TaxID=47424 RepID=A0AA39JV22_9AGAR|nr:homeobox KN domain-containing protein [Armillaria borealis]
MSSSSSSSSLLTSSSSMADLSNNDEQKPNLDDDRVQLPSIFTGFSDDARELRRSSLPTLHSESRRHAPYPRPSYTSSNLASYTFPPTSEETATTYAADSGYGGNGLSPFSPESDWNSNSPGIVRPSSTPGTATTPQLKYDDSMRHQSYPTPMLRISGQQRSYPSHSLPPTLPTLPPADSPYPSVGPDGAPPVERPQRKRGKLPKETTDFLKAWLHRHSDHPYPSEEEKKQLCHATGLSMSQVSNWMINARRRILAPARPSSGPTTTAPFPPSMGARRASLPATADSLQLYHPMSLQSVPFYRQHSLSHPSQHSHSHSPGPLHHSPSLSLSAAQNGMYYPANPLSAPATMSSSNPFTGGGHHQGVYSNAGTYNRDYFPDSQ